MIENRKEKEQINVYLWGTNRINSQMELLLL